MAADMEMEERLVAIETAIALQEKIIDDLNQVVIEQGKKIDTLQKQNQYLLNNLAGNEIKPLSEETPPPHY